MENNKNQLIQEIAAQIKNSPSKIYMIGISGIPGAGKTTFAQQLQQNLPSSKIVPMDGYHLYRKDLTEEQMKRRGSPPTFDKNKLKNDLKSLRENKEGKFPSFDHALKDPIENDIQITKNDQFIIVEGLYLFFEDWDIIDLFDIKYTINCSLELSEKRLIKRHIEAGIVQNEEQGINQVRNNDLLNAQQILLKSIKKNEVSLISSENNYFELVNQ